MNEEQFWVPHPTEVVLPGRLKKQEGDKSFYETDLGIVEVPAATVLDQIIGANARTGVNDVCTLDSVTDATLLHAVRMRYKRDEIYTNVSRILVALNPFKALPIYDDQHLQQYHAVQDAATLPPHIFGIGSDVFRKLNDEGQSQAVLISGESGAGKTESTKLVLLYISQSFSKEAASGFEDKILEINPILEAFGNAKTVRNNNSSRFGKWIEVLVDPITMSLGGASITDYLLEVTRVCGQGPGERNYHIFYQLVQDKSSDLVDLKLSGGAESFAYLKANPANDPKINDEEGLSQLRKAIAGLEFSTEDQDEVFRIVAGILHLGNITFHPDAEETHVTSPEALSTVAQLFGCKEDDLSSCMCKKRLIVGKDVTMSPIGEKKAAQARDSMAKLVYSRLFKWLVDRCNKALGAKLALDLPDDKLMPFIGVLDIAGFESFENNSLEQLFINLSNEKLQQFFNNYIFKSELKEYAAEGIEVGQINFADNADILELLEGKGGVLLLLDDSTNGLKQTDGTFTAAVAKAHEKHARFIKPKFPNEPYFSIKHFAGDVKYTTHGFLEKNIAQQPPEVLELLCASESNSVLQELGLEAAEPPPPPATPRGEPPASPRGMPATPRGTLASPRGGGIEDLPVSPRSGVRAKTEGALPNFKGAGSLCVPGRGGGGGGARKQTVGMAFRKSLSLLVEKFGQAQAHFIRCIKPNPKSVPGMFESPIVLEQLQLSGVMEAVKIRKAGFPIRQAFEDFVKRYIILVPTAKRAQFRKALEGDKQEGVSKELLTAISDVLVSKVHVEDYRMGKAKVFLREVLYRSLEKFRRLAFLTPTVDIQRVWRGHRLRESMKEVKQVNKALQDMLDNVGLRDLEAGSVIERKKRATVMESSLTQVDILMKRAEALAVRLPILQHMRKARARIAAESQIARGMQTMTAEASLDMAGMEALLARAADYSMKGDVVDALRKRCETLGIQLPQSRSLKACLEVGLESLEEVQKRVREAVAAGLDTAGNWIVPDGFQHFEAAQAKLKELEAEKRKVEEEIEARKAAEEAERKRQEELAAAKAAAEAAQAEANRLLLEKMQTAAKEYDAKELEVKVREAEECDIPAEKYAAEKKLFLDLQSGEFLQAELKRLRSEQSNDPLTLLIKSNLAKQMEALGLQVMTDAEDMKRVAAEMMSNLHSKEKTKAYASVFDSEDAMQLKVAEHCFGNLGNFSKLRDAPQITDESSGVPAMFRWTADHLPQTLTNVDDSLQRMGIVNFTTIQRCMGDRPAAYIGDKAEPILNLAKRTAPLRDEVYLQIVKQLNDNPSKDSSKRGWNLLKALCRTVLPSPELYEYLRFFIKRAAEMCKEPATAAASEEDGGQFGRKTSQSKSSIAERRQKNSGTACSGELEALIGEVKRALLETAELIHKTGDLTADSANQFCDVLTENGSSRPFKYKKDLTLEELHQKMQKALRVRWEDNLEFFAMDPDDKKPPWRYLDRGLLIDDVLSKLSAAGHSLFFGRINVTADEELPVEDVPYAYLTYKHAVRQYRGYNMSLSPESISAVPQIAAALIAVHRIQFANDKTMRGKDHRRALDKDLQGGLAGQGVLERYVPSTALEEESREELAQQVLKAYRQLGNEEGAFEFVVMSRALALMQKCLPMFDAYYFDNIMVLEGELDLSALEWDHAVLDAPEAIFDELEMGIDHQLMLCRDGVQLISPVGMDMWIPIMMEPQRHLSGWTAHEKEGKHILVLSIMEAIVGDGEKVHMSIILETPADIARSVSDLLSYFDRSMTF
eukprot:TRINITY_DN13523_c0_g4_i1.p1 TRINITY_DN13523_c0_g4~~TRINITY_DN13523_c0_g4_i1.p1  ORF type:complete len:1763 (+),score=562.82 TRINITY_DN13523_c0_g4_i1:146-5434(+)